MPQPVEEAAIPDPMVTILRACCIESVRHYTTHWLSSLVILIGVIINLVTLKDHPNDSEDGDHVSFS